MFLFKYILEVTKIEPITPDAIWLAQNMVVLTGHFM